MRKPKIWRFNNKWYCGQYMSQFLKAPVVGPGNHIGIGESPAAAYASWVRCKWGVARAILRHRKERESIAHTGRRNPMCASSGPAPSIWRLPKWLKA